MNTRYNTYHNNELHLEQVPLQSIAQSWGTPCYIYSKTSIKDHWFAYQKALEQHRPGSMVCYAVKANSNLSILRQLAQWGAGFDIVSQGELARVLAAGADPQRIVFSGVGKSNTEIEKALQTGIYCFNVESVNELHRIQALALHIDQKAPVSLRINPDITPDTHHHITTGSKNNKFGIPHNQALSAYHTASRLSHIHIMGIDCHIGSQITQHKPFLQAANTLMKWVNILEQEGIPIHHINLGGGLGVDYTHNNPIDIASYIHTLCDTLNQAKNSQDLRLILEPGRSIVAHAGLLLTQILDIKSTDSKHFIVVDAGMNDLMRPTLYEAWHDIQPLKQPNKKCKSMYYDIVGPICESSDTLAKHRKLSVQIGDILAIMDVGAYGFCMSSRYNSRPCACEIMIDQDRSYVIRRRETIEELMAHEQQLAP